MKEMLWIFFYTSLTGAAVALVWFLARPLMKKFSAGWNYTVLRLILLFFILPLPLLLSRLGQMFPKAQTDAGLWANAAAEPPAWLKLLMQSLPVLLLIWLIGAAALAGWYFYCGRRLWKRVKKRSVPVSAKTLEEAGVENWRVPTRQSQDVSGPVLVGFLRPVLLLPRGYLNNRHLRLALAHELIHFKRRDLWVKLAAVGVCIVHWYNPFAYLLRHELDTWCEFSCDERLVADFSRDQRKEYGFAILDVLERKQQNLSAVFCSPLGGDRRKIERRLTMLLNAKKMNKKTALIAAATMAALIGCGSVTAMALSQAAPEENVPMSVVTRIEAVPAAETTTSVPVDWTKLTKEDVSAQQGENSLAEYVVQVEGEGFLQEDGSMGYRMADGSIISVIPAEKVSGGNKSLIINKTVG